MYPVYSNELYHHGIKGQKWGVRRYQNEDGSLTVAGHEQNEIKKQGINSAAYQKLKLERLEERAKEYAEDNPDNPNYFKSEQRRRDMGEDWANTSEDLKMLMDNAKAQEKHYKNSADAYMRANKALMDMPINVNTKRREMWSTAWKASRNFEK